MKKLIILILLSENNVLLSDGSPLSHLEWFECMTFIRKTVASFPVILFNNFRDSLQHNPKNLLPYKKAVIVSKEEVILQPAENVTETRVATFDDALALMSDEQTMYVIADVSTLTTCVNKYSDLINYVLVQKLPVTRSITDESIVFELPIEMRVNWFPVPKGEGISYRHNPILS